MAKIQTATLKINLSWASKDDADDIGDSFKTSSLIEETTLNEIQTVLEQLLPNYVVEIK